MLARPAGDAALLVEADGVAGQLAADIVAQRWPGVLDAIPGARTVLVRITPGSGDLGELARRISALPRRAAAPGGQPLAELPVCYDGPDLAEVARIAGLSQAEVVARHAGAEYTVGWLGFSPGFGYLTGLDPALCGVPRLDRPRLRVPAGSVAIAGGLAAVYPTASPGGWRLLGRTSATLWDPHRDPPALLAPGMRVRFRPVPHLPDPPPAHPPDRDDFSVGDDFSVNIAEKSSRSSDDRSWIEVIRPGPLATVQDLGRPGLGHLGVRQCGAADAESLQLANQLVGNSASAAGIELTFGRAAFGCLAPCWLAVTGAPVTVSSDEVPGHAAVRAGFGGGFWVPAGGVVRLGAPAAGLRTYLAVRGGIDVPAVLGSRSADLVSGLGPAPLRAGDVLPVGDPRGHPADAAGTATGWTEVTRGPVLLTVIPGPRDDWFASDAVGVLCGPGYTVSTDSDRTGLRLAGPELRRASARELPSEGLVTGALQVPPDGQPILLLADHPVTGGYPVIAVVRSADIGRAAQLRPGQQVRFAVSRR
jgi:KipI family sensor histidine kinase inhibitor